MKQEVSSPPPPTFNVDNQVIFTLFVEKNAIFSNIDKGDSRIRDTAQVSQLLLAGIVGSINTKTKVKKVKKWSEENNLQAKQKVSHVWSPFARSD